MARFTGKSLLTFAGLAVAVAVALAGCSASAPQESSPPPTRPTSAAPVTTPSSSSTPAAPVATGPRSWRDACLLTLDELNAIMQPLVDSGWADMWKSAVSTYNGESSLAEAHCIYEGDSGMGVGEIEIRAYGTQSWGLAGGTFTATNAASGFEAACAAANAGPAYSYEPNNTAICDQGVGKGVVVPKDRGEVYVFAGDDYYFMFRPLSIGIGDRLTAAELAIAQAGVEGWTFG